MALPASDNFNRADGALGSNWTHSFGGSGPNIVSNAITHGNGSRGGHVWNADTFPDDGYVQATIAAVGTGSEIDYMGIGYRMSSSADTGVYWYRQADGNAGASVEVYSAGTRTHRTFLSDDGAAGEVVRLEVEGTDVRVYYDGVLHTTISSPTGLPASGSAGVLGFRSNGGMRLDDWSAGALGGGGDPAPSITDVDEDNTITSTQSNVEIDGADFDTATVEIRQGSTVVGQSIDSQDADTIIFDVVFDAGGGPHLKYGSATLAVINADDQEDTQAITIIAPAGMEYVDLDTPNTTADNRITAVADLAAGDQLEISNVQGGDIDDITVLDDATFEAAEGVTAFDVRAWDASDSTWGSVGTQQVSALVDVNDATHGHTADAPTLSVGVTLSVNAATHGHTADSPTITQGYIASAADARHGHTSDLVALSQANTLDADDAQHGHTADAPTLTQGSQLDVDDATHGHSADSPALAQGYSLSVADAVHAHTADALTLVQQFSLTVADAAHGHAADNVELSLAALLQIADATHGHSADQVSLTQASTITVNDARHGHRADSPAIALRFTLAVNDAVHGHTADIVTLTSGMLLAVNDARHHHTAAGPTLVPVHVILSVHDSRHRHTAEAPAIYMEILGLPPALRNLNYQTTEARRFGWRPPGTEVRSVAMKDAIYQVRFAKRTDS